MQSKLVRWWIAFSIGLVAILSALAVGGVRFIVENDATKISWIVLSVFLFGSIQLGLNLKKKASSKSYTPDTNFFINTCGSLGMLGTIIGLIITMMGAFKGIDASDVESIKAAITSIGSGIGAALVTTLVGLVSALLLEAQLAFVDFGE